MGNHPGVRIPLPALDIVDDVISTGNSLSAIEKLTETANGKVIAKACVLAEGKASERKDIIFLNSLPLFEK